MAGGRTGEQELHRGGDRCRGDEQVSSNPMGDYNTLCHIPDHSPLRSPVGILTDI